jgi:hypothetical protein
LNGFQWRLEQGKPATALPELMNSISINIERVNPKSADAISANWVDSAK